MEYQEALEKALRIEKDLAPFCERISIAGSIRRQKKEGIKDIEIVCVPKTYPTFDMFGAATGYSSVLTDFLPGIMQGWRATSTKNGERYKAIIFPDATKLDLFIVTKEAWGYQFCIRTGPADYSHWLVTQRKFGGALPSWLKVKDARLYSGNTVLDTSEEELFFSALQISPVPLPSDRKAPFNFQIKKK